MPITSILVGIWRICRNKLQFRNLGNRKLVLDSFIAFLKSTLNFEYLEKKDQSQSLSITENINCETDSYLNVQKAIFHATLWHITC